MMEELVPPKTNIRAWVKALKFDKFNGLWLKNNHNLRAGFTSLEKCSLNY